MTSRIRPANRQQAKPLIGLYAESGCGKTYSSLLLARGFSGPSGKICMIETESGRGESYANPAEYPEIGGYDVLPLREPFSPKAYGEAIGEVERAGYDCLVIDSASHEWEGAGGVLSMAAQNQEAGKRGPIVWQQPKMDHQKHFMLRFMQTPIPLVILNMRAKYPMEEVVKNGKKEWTRSESLDPKQSEDILFEMFVHGWIGKDHSFHPTKITAKSLASVFADGKPLTLDTGRALAQWASGSPQPAAPETNEQKTKRIAKEIVAAIQACSSLGELENVRHDFERDVEDIKAASQKAYDYIMAADETKANALEGQ